MSNQILYRALDESTSAPLFSPNYDLIKSIVPFTYLPIDEDRLASFKQACYDANVSYGFGSKDPDPGQPFDSSNPRFTEIDCSGFVGSILYYSTHNVISHSVPNPIIQPFPDGSEQQAEWLSSRVVNTNPAHEVTTRFFKTHPISSVDDYLAAIAPPETDNLVRICFHIPSDSSRSDDSTGHVWLAVHDHSIESYGHHGPGERPLTSPILQDICDLVVVLGPLVSSADWKYPLQ